MKKIFLIFVSFLLICLTAINVASQELPMFISGTVEISGQLYSNHEIKVTDVDLGYTWTTYTQENGKYMVVLNNLYDAQGRRVYGGHTINLDACDYNLNTACRKTIVAGYDPVDVSWTTLQVSDIDPNAVKVEDVNWCNANVCSKISCEPCQVCETCIDECVPVVCPTPEVCEECPEDDCGQPLWAVIAEIIGLAGIASGVTYYSRRNISTVKGVTVRIRIGADGKKIVEHLHRGLRNYHDPKTTHTDLKERHPKGELYPLYEKDETGKYIYIPEK